jgi:phosphohistidine phosphatase
MRLLIVRHGLAGKADPGTWPDDDLRPLTPKGLRAFARAAAGLRRACPETGAVFASPALRTLQTAWILAKALGMKRKEVVPVPALHHAASPRAALKALSRRAPAGDFAVVGHEPNLGELASLLVSGSPRGAALPLGKGAACLIEIAGGSGGGADSLAPGAGRLLWSMTQDQLAALGRARARR